MDLVNVGSGNVGGYAIWRGWKIILDAGFLKVFFPDSVCVFIGRRDTYVYKFKAKAICWKLETSIGFR